MFRFPPTSSRLRRDMNVYILSVASPVEILFFIRVSHHRRENKEAQWHKIQTASLIAHRRNLYSTSRRCPPLASSYRQRRPGGNHVSWKWKCQQPNVTAAWKWDEPVRGVDRAKEGEREEKKDQRERERKESEVDDRGWLHPEKGSEYTSKASGEGARYRATTFFVHLRALCRAAATSSRLLKAHLMLPDPRLTCADKNVNLGRA